MSSLTRVSVIRLPQRNIVIDFTVSGQSEFLDQTITTEPYRITDYTGLHSFFTDNFQQRNELVAIRR